MCMHFISTVFVMTVPCEIFIFISQIHSARMRAQTNASPPPRLVDHILFACTTLHPIAEIQGEEILYLYYKHTSICNESNQNVYLNQILKTLVVSLIIRMSPNSSISFSA